jgi:hypothetical protein
VSIARWKPKGVPSGARLNDPIGEKQDEVARLEGDRRGARKLPVRENSERRAGAFQQPLHAAAGIENAAAGVAGTGLDEATGTGVEPSEEQGDEVIATDILDETTVHEGCDLVNSRVSQ